MRKYAGIGSRKTPDDVLFVMQLIAKHLALQGWLLRSGGGEGADLNFEQGARLDRGPEPEIFLPWRRFRGHGSRLFQPTEEAYIMASRYHPAWSKLNGSGMALMARNSHQVLGLNLSDPVDMVVCWTPGGAGGGGTGQALRIARDFDIPIFDLAIPGKKDELREFVR